MKFFWGLLAIIFIKPIIGILKFWLFVNCSGLKSAKIEKGRNLSFLF